MRNIRTGDYLSAHEETFDFSTPYPLDQESETRFRKLLRRAVLASGFVVDKGDWTDDDLGLPESFPVTPENLLVLFWRGAKPEKILRFLMRKTSAQRWYDESMREEATKILSYRHGSRIVEMRNIDNDGVRVLDESWWQSPGDVYGDHLNVNLPDLAVRQYLLIVKANLLARAWERYCEEVPGV